MDLQRAFEILEIDENASSKEIKQKYRDLASIWHPDRHSDNPRRYKLSAEKMKELNSAYGYICNYVALQEEAEIRDAEGNEDEQLIIRCKSCGTKNRVGGYSSNYILKCGKCGTALFGYETTEQEDGWQERTLCGDDECIGTIGSDGRCNYCGKSFDEGTKKSDYKDQVRDEERLKQQTVRHRRKSTLKKVYYASFGIAVVILLISYGSKILIDTEDKSVSVQTYTTLDSLESNYQASQKKPIINSDAKSKPQIIDPSKVIWDEIPNYESYFTKEYFRGLNLDKHQVRMLQRNLFIIGYKVGGADGILGDKTINEIKQFSEDFNIVPKDNFFQDLLKSTHKHALISKDHPDWCEIFKGNELEQWINKQPPKFKEKIANVDTENPKVLTYLFTQTKKGIVFI